MIALRHIVIGVICSTAVHAQTIHFSFTKNTGLYATVAVPVSCQPTLDGAGITQGDEIAVFTTAGRCVGAAVWTGANIAVNVWPDNPFTPEPDGILSGEEMKFRLWQKQSNKEFPYVTAQYAMGTGSFVPNGLYVLSSVTAFSFTAPPMPMLSAPIDGAIDVPLTPQLEWQPSPGASEYLVHLSADSTFRDLIDPGVVTTTRKTTPALSARTAYYWRVRSGNAAGISEFSPVFRFTTLSVTSRKPEGDRVASEFRLEQNYPNPFNPETRVDFSVAKSVHVKLSVYDVLGRETAVLADGLMQPGWYSAAWNASGRASGVYLCRITAGAFTAVKMMMLAK